MHSNVFMGRFLNCISDGDLFKKVFATILRIVAIVVAIGGLYLWIRLWSPVFHLGGFFAVVSGIIFQLILIVTIAMMVHIVWLRAGTIGDLQKADFTVIPISSILLKMTGELYVVIFVPLSIGGGIGIWLGGGNLMYFVNRFLFFLPELPFDFMRGGESSFLGGLLFIVGGIVAAFLSLVFFYLLAEMLVVAVDIARNIKVTREIAEGYKKPEAAI